MPNKADELPMLATPKQAAEVMGPTEAQVRGLIRAGRIAHVPVGKRVMIPREAIVRFIQENTVQPCPVETQEPVSAGSTSADATTSFGLSAVAAGSAARALKIAAKLKSPSRTSSTGQPAQAAPVIPLRSS
jgi:excisionase family DNA binding protein